MSIKAEWGFEEEEKIFVLLKAIDPEQVIQNKKPVQLSLV